jgi:hypothetical protein
MRCARWGAVAVLTIVGTALFNPTASHAADTVRTALAAARTPAAVQALRGVEAFERSNPGYRPRPDGYVSYEEVERAFADAERAAAGKVIAPNALRCIPAWYYIKAVYGGWFVPNAAGNVNATGNRAVDPWNQQFLICRGDGWNPLHYAFYANRTGAWLQPTPTTGRVQAIHVGELTTQQLFSWGWDSDAGAYYMWSYHTGRYLGATLNQHDKPVWATSPAILGWEMLSIEN